MLNLVHAETGEHIEHIHKLFVEYAASLGFDLCFQDFDNELAGLPGDYAPPNGQLILGLEGGKVVGCVALRRAAEGICEMKRLYVRPKFRGRGYGRALAVAIIDEARKIGYQRMRLDTVASMTEAIALYRSLGFQSTEPYRYNPLERCMFMELILR